MERDKGRSPEKYIAEKYMDMISGDFAYDPVRLPLDQDSTQCLYNRKTLETIWETAREARNPYTRQWFDVKYAIPQKELRKEMEDYINLRNIPINAEIDVIADYTKIVEEGEMKQLLETLRPDNYTLRKSYWNMAWKKINLIRLYCQSNVQNIQTFRNLNGYTYFKEIVARVNEYFIIYNYRDIRKHSASMNICKEILRLFDLIGLISTDMVGENSMGYDTIKSLINIIWYFYFYSLGFVKIGTIVLRFYSKIFHEFAADTVNVLGWQGYLNALQGEESEGPVSVLSVAIDKFSFTDQTDARNILSEDLNHGITILRRYFLVNAMIVNNQQYATAVADALILCISREIDISDKREFSEGQMREARTERLHNSEALEKGLRLVNDVISRGGMLADILQNTQIVKNIVDMLKLHLTFVCEKEGCIKFAGCIHIRIVILALEILQTVSKRGVLFGIDAARIFYEIVKRTTSKNPEFRVEDLMDHFSHAFCHFYLYICKTGF